MANILRKWIESDRRELRRINRIANKVERYAKPMSLNCGASIGLPIRWNVMRSQ